MVGKEGELASELVEVIDAKRGGWIRVWLGGMVVIELKEEEDLLCSL